MNSHDDPHADSHPLSQRFRGFLPVIIDVETGGFNANADALLEIAATTITMNDHGELVPLKTHAYNVVPEAGLNLDPAALEFTGIDPFHPFREAISEDEALTELFQVIRKNVKKHDCNRAVLVGHNAFFDHAFLFAATERQGTKRNPFHPFSIFDTATLSGLAFGQTVLAKTCALAGIEFDNREAHSAAYDAQKTAELFCLIVNKWQTLGGWPLIADEGAEWPPKF